MQYHHYEKDAQSLAIHASVCSKMPTVYLWGGLGEVITEELIQKKQLEYPSHYTDAFCDELRKLIDRGVRGYDCSGLIKSFLMGGLPNYSYDPAYDLNSKSLLNHSKTKGKISTMPEYSGICLYLPGHVGIYMGNGNVIESTNNIRFGNGVVNTKLEDREWTDWFCCPFLEYPGFPF